MYRNSVKAFPFFEKNFEERKAPETLAMAQSFPPGNRPIVTSWKLCHKIVRTFQTRFPAL